MPGHGSTQQDFDFAWAGLAQTPFKFTAAPGMQPKAVLKGWQFLIGNSKYNDNGVATLAMLISFSGGNNMQAICILSNSDSYKKDIEDFLASVDVSKDIAPSGSAQNSNTISATTPAGNAAQKTNPSAAKTIDATLQHPEYALWMANHPSLKNLAQTEYKYVVLSADGTCLYYLPEQGLYNVTKGNKLVLNNDRYGKMELYKKTATAMAGYNLDEAIPFWQRMAAANKNKVPQFLSTHP